MSPLRTLRVPPAARVVGLVAALQFVYIVDFMAVLPLGPDAARALGFAADRLGWLSAAYTLASLLSGALCLRFIDRFERKRALLAVLVLFGAATFATGFAGSFEGLLLTRAATGFFGGPMVALGMAMVIDVSAPHARGKAIAQVMLGFSLAAIAGVPLALELAQRGDWAKPFAALSVAIAVLGGLMAWALPALPARADGHAGSGLNLLRRPAVRTACLLQAASQFSAFLLIPSFSAFYLLNLGLPRDQLGTLYLLGGVAALLSVQALGRAADRWGAGPAVAVATLAIAAGLLPFFGIDFGFGAWPWAVPFVLFMAGNAGRNVSLAAATSQVPSATERAAFMSLQSMVQDLAITAAAMVAAVALHEGVDGRLHGMAPLAAGALAISAGLAWRVGRAFRRPPTRHESRTC